MLRARSAFPSVALGTLTLLALVSLRSEAGPATVEAADAPLPTMEAPRARILTGHIQRDTGTEELIRSTGNHRIPRNVDDRLRLVLNKSRYRLDVFDDDALVKVYPVALGGRPEGPKIRMGDSRTPEGDYELVPHHPSPNFGGCFYVNYPAPADAHRALETGLIDARSWADIVFSLRAGGRPPYATPLGGLILIHGTKDRTSSKLTASNWTEGCIAMENTHLLELLDAFAPTDRPKLTIWS